MKKMVTESYTSSSSPSWYWVLHTVEQWDIDMKWPHKHSTHAQYTQVTSIYIAD